MINEYTIHKTRKGNKLTDYSAIAYVLCNQFSLSFRTELDLRKSLESSQDFSLADFLASNDKSINNGTFINFVHLTD